MNTALQTMIANMPEKTGKSLEEWKVILRTKGFNKHSDAVNYLKKDHSVTHGFANTIVQLSKENYTNDEDLVSAQYKGKQGLLPIYRDLLQFIKSLGNDVIISPKKSSVSVIRKRQFVLIKPATKTRIDLGFKLKDHPTTERLENSGPFGTMCTHRVKLFSKEDIDHELKNWIKEAYNQSV